MACEKAGTASVLGYPVILLLLQRYSITASFVKTAMISFPATTTRIACIYMASHSVALVAEWTISQSHMDNVENQCIIRLCTNYFYCINIGSDIGPLAVLYRY